LLAAIAANSGRYPTIPISTAPNAIEIVCGAVITASAAA